ncbi:MAG: hypothetical protein ACI9MJ_000332 [Alphaproteobacteria bacterium]|jgi:hypothetical protein
MSVEDEMFEALIKASGVPGRSWEVRTLPHYVPEQDLKKGAPTCRSLPRINSDLWTAYVGSGCGGRLPPPASGCHIAV